MQQTSNDIFALLSLGVYKNLGKNETDTERDK